MKRHVQTILWGGVLALNLVTAVTAVGDTRRKESLKELISGDVETLCSAAANEARERVDHASERINRMFRSKLENYGLVSELIGVSMLMSATGLVWSLSSKRGTQ